jgi:hypothetical protein
MRRMDSFATGNSPTLLATRERDREKERGREKERERERGKLLTKDNWILFTNMCSASGHFHASCNW